ncbi:hypothetical protein KSF73_10185 [Burkholderiaceae bacterium DAT-1]|nr:hypothetical protein [Burkholderiaceae bacterium DAT-1]
MSMPPTWVWQHDELWQQTQDGKLEWLGVLPGSGVWGLLLRLHVSNAQGRSGVMIIWPDQLSDAELHSLRVRILTKSVNARLS